MYYNPEVYMFEPREVWLCLYHLQHDLADHNKDYTMFRRINVGMILSGGAILMQPSEERNVPFGVMVWAVYVFGNNLALSYRMPQLVPLPKALIDSNAGLMGAIGLIAPAPHEVGKGNNTATARRDTIKIASRDSAMTQPLQADSGSITCFEDPNLVIRYNFDHRPLDPARVFTAFLMSNVFCSEYGGHSINQDVDMEAFSSDRQVRVRMHSVQEGTGVGTLTWKLASLALRTIFQHLVMGFQYSRGGFVDGPRWEAMSFLLDYKGVKVGQGFIG